MKKKIYTLIIIMLVIIAATVIALNVFSEDDEKEIQGGENISLVTSFYPVYIIASNLGLDITEIQLSSLTDFSTGCLHDYQLTTNNMKLLENGDVFVMNGGGMEGFIGDVVASYPDIYIIDSSKDIDMLESQEHEGEPNPHIWLDPDRYTKQIVNVRDGLISYIEEHKTGEVWQDAIAKVNGNADKYIDQVRGLNEKYNELVDKKTIGQKKVVAFHESFAYLADRIGFDVVHTIEVEGDESLSASEIAQVIELINEENIPYLFTELQFGNSISDRIEEETHAQIFIIDSAVTGDGSTGSYIDAMEDNLLTLKQAID